MSYDNECKFLKLMFDCGEVAQKPKSTANLATLQQMLGELQGMLRGVSEPATA